MKARRLAFAAGTLLATACFPPAPVELAEPEGLERMPAPVQRQYHKLRGALEAQLDGGDSSPSRLSGANGRLGMWYHAYRDLPPAEALYRVALAHNPKNGRHLYYLGHLYRTSDRPQEAREAFKGFLAMPGATVAGRVWLAELEESLGDTETAARHFKKALRMDPRCGRAHDGLGRLAMREGDWEGAARHFQAALRSHPGAMPVAASLAMARHNLGVGPPPPPEKLREVGRGRVGRRRLTMDDPLLDELMAMDLRPGACVQRARRFEREGRHAEAAQDYRLAVEADPDRANLHIRLGETLSRAGQLDPALRVFEKALQRWPEEAALLVGIGMTRARAGDVEAARQRLQEAVAIEPGMHRALVGLGTLSLGEGELEDALARFEAAVSAAPEAPLPRYWRTLALVRLGREAEAVAGLEEGLEAAPGRELDLTLARLLAGATDQRLRDPERARTLAWPHRRTLAGAESLAMALAGCGKMREAALWQKAAVASAGRARAAGLSEEARERLQIYEQGREPAAPGLDHLVGALSLKVKPPRMSGDQST